MTLEDLRELAEKEQTRQAQFEHRILYCSSAGCVSGGCDAVKAEMKKAIDELGLSKKCELIGTGCLGLCGEGPLVYVHSDPTLYQHVDVKTARRIVEEHIGQGKKVTDHEIDLALRGSLVVLAMHDVVQVQPDHAAAVCLQVIPVARQP